MRLYPFRRRSSSALAVVGAVLAAAFAAGCAGLGDGGESSEAVPLVGLMHVGTDHVPPSLGGLTTALEEEYGWDLPEAQVEQCAKEKSKRCVFEGEDVTVVWRNLEPEEADAQAEVFVGQGADVIVAFEDSSIKGAQKATVQSRTPIVFLHPNDPVRDGLVKTLARPDANLTGVFGARDEVDKQLELYQRLVRGMTRVLTLVDPEDRRTESLLADYQKAAAALPTPIEPVIREATTKGDLRRIFRSLPEDVDGVFMLSPSLRLNHTALTIELAKRARLPVQAHRKEWVLENGALFSYGIDLPLIGRTGARYVDRILRGEAPAELPVREVPKIEFAINRETAAELGLELPQELVTQAHYRYP